MPRHRRTLLAVAALALAVAIVASWWPSRAAPAGDPLVGRVARVLDGDTIVVALPSGDEHVRVVGVDTPEIPHPGKAAGCYGDEARRAVVAWLAGRSVRLAPALDPRDRYGRLLAHVVPLGGPLAGRDLARALAARGLARPLPIAPNTQDAPAIDALVAAARRDGRGLWGRCGMAAAFPRAVAYDAGRMAPTLARVARIGGIAALGGAAYGLFESQHVVRHDVEAPIAGIPSELDGLVIAHLSDLHLGAPGLTGRAVRRALAIAEAAAPDVVCVTGDLRTRERGEPALREVLARLARLAPTFVVRGNHDIGAAHDPFASRRPLGDIDGTGAVILDDAVARLALRGVEVAIGGVHPAGVRETGGGLSRVLDGLAGAPVRVLLSHYPDVIDAAAGRVHLVLAGHMHGGQLALPYPGGRVPLSCPGAPYPGGTFGRDGTLLHVTHGIGTTLVPFRFLARPDVAVVRLRAI